MKAYKNFVCLIAAICGFLVSCSKDNSSEVKSVKANFSVNLVSEQARALVTVINKSEEATDFSWKFIGGIPAVSSDKNPGTITYNRNGTYTIELTASEGDNVDVKTVEIVVTGVNDTNSDTESVTAIFSINLISEQDNATVTLVNKSIGATEYEWSFPGGSYERSTDKTPDAVTYSENGTYTITLIAKRGDTFSKKRSTITISGLS